MAADAQRAAGALPTAEPFTRTTRRRVPAPPLRVGDRLRRVRLHDRLHRARSPPPPGSWPAPPPPCPPPPPPPSPTAGPSALTHPGHAPARVTDFTATDGTETFCNAIDALDGALGLSRPGAARLLVIVSDGDYSPDSTPTGSSASPAWPAPAAASSGSPPTHPGHTSP